MATEIKDISMRDVEWSSSRLTSTHLNPEPTKGLGKACRAWCCEFRPQDPTWSKERTDSLKLFSLAFILALSHERINNGHQMFFLSNFMAQPYE